jgi:hydroxyacylglutathione hydrolase
MLANQQFRYSSDNLGYVIYGEKTAMAIDGGAVDEILQFLEEKHLTLTYVTNTHGHPDHMSGTDELVKQSGATYLSPIEIAKKEEIDIDGNAVRIYHTPGHTEDSVAFHFGNFLITGDTLFNGTVGNCFSENMAAFFHSIKVLISFPGDTIVYAGHDYVEYSMTVAEIIEPNNPHFDSYLKKYNPNHVYATLNDEMLVNPYVRFNDPAVIEILKEKSLPIATEFERWESIMTLG